MSIPKRRMVNMRVTREELNMIRLKAAIYNRGDVSAFLRTAAAAYQKPLPDQLCLSCDGTMEYRFDGTIRVGNAKITQAPHMVCTACGEGDYDYAVLEVLEEMVGDQEGVVNFRTLINQSDEKVSDGASTQPSPAVS